MAAVQHELGGRDRIVIAARHLFATQGFHQTSMAELAMSARVSIGLIYRLFTGKSDIILAIISEEKGERIAEMIALSDQVRAGTLSVEKGFLQVARRALEENDEALAFEILAEAHRNAGVAGMIAELCVRYRAVLRDLACVANPALTTEELDGAEEMLLALIFGLGHRTLSGPRLSVEDTAQRTTAMVLAALRAR